MKLQVIEPVAERYRRDLERDLEKMLLPLYKVGRFLRWYRNKLRGRDIRDAHGADEGDI